MTAADPRVTPLPASPGPLADTPEALFAAERDALEVRRREAFGGEGARSGRTGTVPRIGLALSGGGVRSATFALGLVRGLAKNRLLGHFDYLSTVSGGGYVGAMFGRLVNTHGLQRAQALMADGNSFVLRWLRRNGRYLTPSGSRDIGIAVATYLRSWLAIHTEFMFAALLLALAVVMPHLVQHSTLVLTPASWAPWVTPWWPLAVAWWVLTAPGLVTGYWAARDAPDPDALSVRPQWRDLALLGLMAVVATGLFVYAVSGGPINLRRDALDATTLMAFALASAVAGQALVQGWMMRRGGERHALRVARLRNRLTRALRVCTLVALGLGGLGALDAVSWWVLVALQSGDDAWVAGGVGVGGVVLIVLRSLVQPLQRIAAEAGTHAQQLLPRLLNLAGLGALLALVMLWLVAVQWFLFAPQASVLVNHAPAWTRAVLLGSAWALWVLLTGGNAQMANSSSLHSFYRARLTRAYLAVGNENRKLDAGRQACDDVTEVVNGDDAAMSHYRPELKGGPIHLISTCLNQTRDDSSGLYNADRKGAAVTTTWRGFEVGADGFTSMKPGQDVGTLGRWVAVSGAAASPGAGSYTSRGLALLVYFLGVRLGHWVRAPHQTVPLRWLSRLGWHGLPKPVMLTSEASATFYGARRPWWYLSDGGHFENTAVYALLKRELDFIILSDASCDATYLYGDIENLVRKARIDFGAEIEFYTRGEAARLFAPGHAGLTVISPEEMADNHSCRGVLLARIRYRERPDANGDPFRPEGTLLVVKPNLHDALDVDVLAYARQNDTFPHESTGDQSFDEAQWESYHRLGEDFGQALTAAWLAQVPGWGMPGRHAIDVAARLNGTAPLPAADTEALWRRKARAAALGTTVGLGVTGTVLLSVWQAQQGPDKGTVAASALEALRGEGDGDGGSLADQRAEAKRLLVDVSAAVENLDGSCPAVPAALVSQVEALTALRGGSDGQALRTLERADLTRLTGQIQLECAKEVAASQQCVEARRGSFDGLCALVLKPGLASLALNYWYAADSPNDQARAAMRLIHQATQWTGWGTDGAAVQLPLQPAVPSSPASEKLALACARPEGPTTVYLQVYDDASLAVGTALARTLQRASQGSVRVAVEQVNRAARLSGQRAPVPWTQPTVVLHDPERRECARQVLLQLLHTSGMPDAPSDGWIRSRPAALPRGAPGVLELWLPPMKETELAR